MSTADVAQTLRDLAGTASLDLHILDPDVTVDAPVDAATPAPNVYDTE